MGPMGQKVLKSIQRGQHGCQMGADEYFYFVGVEKYDPFAYIAGIVGSIRKECCDRRFWNL